MISVKIAIGDNSLPELKDKSWMLSTRRGLKIMVDKLIISLFPVYVWLYNLQGRVRNVFGYQVRFKLLPWFDPKIWHRHSEHPSNKPWVRDMVRHIYFSTGIMPTKENQHLLEAKE